MAIEKSNNAEKVI